MTTTTTALYHHDYPYRLKLQHPGLSELRVERKGRWIVIELNDGQQSGPSMADVDLLYGRLAETLAKGRTE